MSIPRYDASLTMADLQKAANSFLEAGLQFWEIRHKMALSGAVVWYKDSSQGTVIFTRGEYDYKLTANIEENGPTIQFGCAAMGEE